MKTLNLFKNACGAALLVLAMALPAFTSCYDDSALNGKLEAVQKEVNQIKTDLTQLKSDLAALQAAVDGELSIVRLNELPDGYELVFSDSTKAVIKNGKASVVGAKEDEDGNLYWTIDGEWLLDKDGNKVKASAEDGQTPDVAIVLNEEDGYYYWQLDGQWLLGSDGNKVRANGLDGKEPVIKTYFSDSAQMWVWEVNGEKLKDEKGEYVSSQGPAGLDGDAFFESVELSEDGTKLVITLLPETEGGEKVVYEIPMGVFNITFTETSVSAEVKKLSGVTTEVKKFNYTVSGVSSGDEIIVRVLSTNAAKVDIFAETPTTGYVELELPSGEGYADIYVLNNTTGDVKAKSLKLSGLDFYLEEQVAATLHFSPVEANEVKIPLTTGVEYEVTLSDNGAEWLTVTSELRTKAVTYENLVLKADANSTGAHRKTTLTIKKKADGSTLDEFVIEQKNYEPGLITDENEEQIEWAEAFELYANESLSGTPTSKKGVFTIALSDDFSKGVYKISNMFMANSYFDNNGQPVSNKGGEYYADLAGDVLTVYRANAVMSYGFISDVEMNYDATAKKFTFAGPVYAGNPGYLANYTAAVKVDAPAGGEFADLIDQYEEDFADDSYNGRPAKGTLTIAASDNADYDLQMTFFGGTSAAVTVYANISDDGTTITTVQPSGYTNMGTFYASTLTVADGVISGTLTFDYPPTVSDYKATTNSEQ